MQLCGRSSQKFCGMDIPMPNLQRKQQKDGICTPCQGWYWVAFEAVSLHSVWRNLEATGIGGMMPRTSWCICIFPVHAFSSQGLSSQSHLQLSGAVPKVAVHLKTIGNVARRHTLQRSAVERPYFGTVISQRYWSIDNKVNELEGSLLFPCFC